jgi:Uma2 family endonuclease
MSNVARESEWMTVDEFLVFEDESPIRHQLIGGFVVAMAGGSKNHNAVALAAVNLLLPSARANGCRVFSSDVLLRVGDDLFYPDVMVVSESSGDVIVETAPCLIVEVLSHSTASMDRVVKRAAYAKIPHLQRYLVVHIDSMSVEMFTRVADRWTRTTVEVGELISLACPRIDLPVADLFIDLAD